MAQAVIVHDGAAMSALCVARVPQRAAARSAIAEGLRKKGLEGQITFLDSSVDLTLDEARRVADALQEGETWIRTFGWDDPRSLKDHLAFSTAPALQPAPRPISDIQGLLFGSTGREVAPSADHSYAVLDAASVFGLPERLENSGLEHACLFSGNAARDYGASAPWLVRLVPDHALTRSLTGTRDGDPLGWKAGPGLMIRSPLSLEGLRRHLRRFTMVGDETGRKRLYFRFYDPRVFRTLIAGAPAATRVRFACGIRQIICPDLNGQVLVFERMATA